MSKRIYRLDPAEGRAVEIGKPLPARSGDGYIGYYLDLKGRAIKVFLPFCGQVRVEGVSA